MTRFISSSARETASKYAVFLIVLGTSFFWSPTASADGTWQATNGLVSGNTVQFDYRGGSATYVGTVTDGSTVTVVVNNTIANCIGTCNPIPDEWTVSINGQSYSGNTIEIITLTAQVSGQLTIAATGRDIGFWGGWYGPIITVSIASPTPAPEPEPSPSPSVSESPTVVVDSPTVVLDTPTSIVESPTTIVPSDSPTVLLSDTLTVVTESSTQTNQLETQTVSTTPSEPTPSPSEPSLPSPPPVVEPEPTPAPVAPTPQPEPQPQPAPAPAPAPQPMPVEQPAPIPVEPPPPVAEEPPAEAPLPEEEPPAPEEEAPPVAEEPPAVEEPAPDVEPLAPPVEEAPPSAPVEEVQQEQTEPVQEPAPEPVVEHVPASQPGISSEPQSIHSVDLESLAPSTPVALDNGVVVTAEVAIAVALLQDPAALVQELFTDPGAALAALGSVGADLPPEVRETAEDVVVSAIIAGGIATQAAASAAATATYRRKP